MDEVIVIPRGQLLEHGMLALEANLVPSDLGHPQARALGVLFREALDAPTEDTEARGDPMFLAFVEEHLDPHAKPQVGAALFDGLLDRFLEAT